MATGQDVLDAVQRAGQPDPDQPAPGMAPPFQPPQTADPGALEAIKTAAGVTDAPPSFMSRLWQNITQIPHELIHPTPVPALPPGQTTTAEALLAGTLHGAREAIDKPAELAARAADYFTGGNEGDRIAAGNAATRKAAEDFYQDHPTAFDAGRTAGKIAVQTAATAPVLRAAGIATQAGARALPGVAGDVATWLTGAAPAESAIGRGTQLAVQGAATGTGAAGLTLDPDQPLGPQLTAGAVTGGLMGPMFGGVTKAIDILRGYTGGVQPEVAQLARTAANMGVNVPVTSMSTNPVLRIAADTLNKLPLSGVGASDLAAHRAAQGVIAREMGSTANTFGPAEMRANADRISQGFQNLTKQVPAITGGTPLANDLAGIGTDATRYLSDTNATKAVGNAIREVGNAFSRGPINADQYLSLTASDGPLARIADGAPSSAQDYIDRIEKALQDRLVASAPSPDIADQLQTLRYQWRVMKTIEPLAAKSTTGDISLGGLQQQVLNQSRKYDSSTGGKAYTGGGVLGQMGDIGKQFFAAMPESGTAPRAQALQFSQHPASAAALAVPGLINRYLQMYLRRPTVSGRIIDTSLGAATPDIGRALPYGLLGPIDYERGAQ